MKHLKFDIREIQKEVHKIAKSKGWYDNGNPAFGDQIANMHSELSEAWEGYRAGNPPSDKIPQFSAEEEELADVIIRILDSAESHNFDVIGAIFEKMEYNRRREYRHGGKVV